MTKRTKLEKFTNFLNKRGFLILPILVFLCYSPVFNGTFLIDDEFFIEKNRYIHDLDVIKIFSSNVNEGAGFVSNFYRPMQQVCFAVLYNVFGYSNLAFHLFSILVQAINTLLLFFVIKKLLRSQITAFFCALIFAVHPILTQAIAFVSGLSEPLGMLFFLSAFLLVFNKKKWTAFLIPILIALALFSKEVFVIILPLSILIFLYLKYQKVYRLRNAWVFLVSGVVLSCIYFALKMTVFNFTEHIGLAAQSNIYTENLWVRLWTFINIIPEYLSMLFLPNNLHYTTPYRAYIDFSNLKWVVGILVITLSAWVIYRLIIAIKTKKIYQKKSNAYRPLVTYAFGILWFWLSLVPYMGIIPLNSMYLEHWLYIPIVGVIIIFITAVNPERQLLNQNKIFKALAISILLVFCVKTFNRAAQWADYESFFINEIKHEGNTAMVHNNLAMYYEQKKKYHKAIKHYKKASQLGNRPEPWYNISSVYIQQKKYKEALIALENALKVNPNFSLAEERYNQIKTYLKQQKKK